MSDRSAANFLLDAAKAGLLIAAPLFLIDLVFYIDHIKSFSFENLSKIEECQEKILELEEKVLEMKNI